MEEAVPSSDPEAEAAGNLEPDDDRVYLVPYRWWAEAQQPHPDDSLSATSSCDAVAAMRGGGIPYAASPAPSSYGGPMRIINNIFGSDLLFHLKRRDPDASEDARAYALIPTHMWTRALRWHKESKFATNGLGNSCLSEDDAIDVYPLMLRISITRDNIMTIKITKKDNAAENYKRACKIFSIDSELVLIWDFSGQTNLIFMNEWNKIPQDSQRQSDQEILLELQIYAPPEIMTCRSDGKREDLGLQQSKLTSFSYGNSLLSNGSLGSMESEFHTNATSKGFSSFGLTGLENLGNTCFMNSAVQCLAHTTKLVNYFLGDYNKEINRDNPLGMDGELALSFGELLRRLCSPDRTPVVPRIFKGKLAHFAPQFSGFSQHDSQELLAFLLDGLHEDLNRVKCKPYIEAKDASGRPPDEVADEYWANHLARNNSIVVDLFHGQYRSTLVCPLCNKVSITFDPFMYLSLPLPSTTMRTMTVTVLSTDGSSGSSSYTINVPKYGKCKDLIQALSVACSLKDDESLLVAEIYSSRIIRYLGDPSDSLSLIRDGDRLVAYCLPKDFENSLLVVFVHQHMEEHYNHGKTSSGWKAFGVPLMSTLPRNANGSTIHKLYLKLRSPSLQSRDVSSDINEERGRSSYPYEVAEMNVNTHEPGCEGIADAAEDDIHVGDELQFYLTDSKCQIMHSKVEMNETVALVGSEKQLHVLACWQDKAMEQCDRHLFNDIPEVYKPGLFVKRPQDSFSLYACLEAFIKEEPLGPEDMWYCPSCKKHQQASKKLDLWRLPKVLVIHLKRFSYSRFMKNKLETFVDFPIQDLDLSDYVAHKSKQSSHHYVLYAIINHYGNMGGGHYTAYVCNEGEDRWYDFDDRHVAPMSADGVKTPAAYLLFYRRVETNSSDTEIILT